MLVRDFMASIPKTLTMKDTLKEVVSLFYKYKIDVAPVLDADNRLAGLVTRTNVIEAIVNESSLNGSIAPIMIKGVITVHPDNSLEEAWQIPVNHLPVVDYEHRIVGMLHRQEFMKIFYTQVCELRGTVEKINKISNDGIILIDYYGIIKEMNEIAGRLMGISPEAAKEKFIYDVFPVCGLMRVMRTGEVEMNQPIESNGRALRVNRAPICEGYKVVGAVAVLKDVAAENDAVNQLRERENKIESLEGVFECLQQGIIVVGTDNVIKLVNTSYEDVMGISREELIGQQAQRAVENSRMHVVLKTGVAELAELQVVKGRQVVVNRVPMFKDGRIIGAIGEAVFKDVSELGAIVERGKTMRHQLGQPNEQCKPEAAAHPIAFEDIIGRTRVLVHVKNLAAKAALTDTTVLVQGESGTGKDLFAQAIHNASPRRDKAFVAINCAAIPAQLLEAELFGYEEGAFTGAKKGGKRGKFEIAEGGTLFLDEIGDMPLEMQAKLLRVMQNKTYERVGGEKVKTCDIRIIAATNKNLQELVEMKSFREDLYYRLNVICLHVPALRERQEDIGALVEALMEKICRGLGIPVKQFSSEAMALLRSYSWPGNVRELINILEQIGATVNSMLIKPKQLPGVVLQQPPLRRKDGAQPAPDEAQRIREVLQDTNGNKVLAAKVLGVHRSTLYEKMKKYGIQ